MFFIVLYFSTINITDDILCYLQIIALFTININEYLEYEQIYKILKYFLSRNYA